jgi:large subunit ribosomal protein L15
MGKTEKHRGSRTHGRGKKAGRGAGMRGGRGNAGLHKHKYITTVKYDPKHFGRYGFKRPKNPNEKEKTTINLGQLAEHLEVFLSNGTAKKTGDMIEIDLVSAKIDKLLGSGNIESRLRIRVAEASRRAQAKVEEAGGEVLLEEHGDNEQEAD